MKLQKILLSFICVVAILLASPLSASAIGFKAEEKYNSVFVIISGNALGSGFAVGENCIITNAHVLDNPNSITLTTYAGESRSAYLVGIDTDKDIAVLCVKNVKFTPLAIADFDALNTGDDVYAIGAPKSMAYTLTKGVISAKERELGNYKYIQTDAAINEGNSGGPLLDDSGSVIGVNTFKMTNSEGIGLAIPMTLVKDFLKSLNIALDENGNVSETIVSEQGDNGEETPSQKKDNNTAKKTVSTPFIVTILLIALGCSVAGNIVLIISLVFQRKKNLILKYNPAERTDFDIDILE